MKGMKRHYSKNNKRYVAAIVIIAVVSLTGWSLHSPKKAHDSAIAVTVVNARLGDLTPQVESIGTAVADNETQIQSQVSGQLTAILVNAGQTVKQGDTLFIIDPAPFQAALDQATALTNKDLATQTFALQQLERYRSLVQSGYVSKDFFAQVLAAAKTAKAAVVADQAAVATARINLEHCTITAPISGRLGDIAPNVGDLINSSATTSMTSIKQMSPIEVQFSLPAKQIPLVRHVFNNPHTQIIATSSDDPQLHASGTLDFVDNQIDVNTGSIIMKAKFNNEPAVIWPGQLLNIHVQAPTERQVILIPNEAIRQNQQGGFYVYRINADHKAHRVPVITGATVDGITAIIQGLHAGDTIVTQGQFRLDDGSAVTSV